MQPFFCYYGGKYRTAQSLYAYPKYTTIYEPFAGSAGYSVRNGVRKAILVDLDPHIVGVWSYLIKASRAEILALPDIEIDQTLDDVAYLPQEAQWLIGFWLNKGASAPCRKPSSWMRSDIRSTSFWGATVKKRIARQVDQIRDWQIIHGSYADIEIKEPATWFVDPPYADAGRHYRFGSKQMDYAHLGEWCRNLPGQVMVCENEGADWLPFEPLGATKACRPNGVKSLEVLWEKE